MGTLRTVLAVIALAAGLEAVAREETLANASAYDRRTAIRLERSQAREIATPGALYQRLRLRLESGGEAQDAFVLLTTMGGRVIQRLDAATLRRGTWTHVVPGQRLELVFQAGALGGTLLIERVIGQGRAGRLQSQWGDKNETQPIGDYRDHPQIAEQARSVAFLSFIRDYLPRVCTGFLVEGGLMTNHHCISTVEVCSTAVAVFGFEMLLDGSTAVGEQFSCLEVVRSDPELDLVLLSLEGAPHETYGVITAAGEEPVAASAAYIIQHASGAAKSIAHRQCSVRDVALAAERPGADFSHTCDTDHGSSGSPVFDGQGRLIGVHHYGFNDGTARWTTNRAVRLNAMAPPAEGDANGANGRAGH